MMKKGIYLRNRYRHRCQLSKHRTNKKTVGFLWSSLKGIRYKTMSRPLRRLIVLLKGQSVTEVLRQAAVCIAGRLWYWQQFRFAGGKTRGKS